MAVQDEEPFEEDLDWLKYGRVMIQESPKILDEAAKTFLTLASTFLYRLHRSPSPLQVQ